MPNKTCKVFMRFVGLAFAAALGTAGGDESFSMVDQPPVLRWRGRLAMFDRNIGRQAIGSVPAPVDSKKSEDVDEKSVGRWSLKDEGSGTLFHRHVVLTGRHFQRWR